MRATGLPWGERELDRAKTWLIGQVDKIQRGEGFLHHPMGARSETGYRFSDVRAGELKERIKAWVPAEPVLPDHRAEAVAIVYNGLREAGLLPWAAYRAPRESFRG